MVYISMVGFADLPPGVAGNDGRLLDISTG